MNERDAHAYDYEKQDAEEQDHDRAGVARRRDRRARRAVCQAWRLRSEVEVLTRGPDRGNPTSTRQGRGPEFTGRLQCGWLRCGASARAGLKEAIGVSWSRRIRPGACVARCADRLHRGSAGQDRAPAQDRVKTDQRDAERVLRLLMIDGLHAVRVPSSEEEALRDLGGRWESAGRGSPAVGAGGCGDADGVRGQPEQAGPAQASSERSLVIDQRMALWLVVRADRKRTERF
jgi:hypothetical protein